MNELVSGQTDDFDGDFEKSGAKRRERRHWQFYIELLVECTLGVAIAFLFYRAMAALLRIDDVLTLRRWLPLCVRSVCSDAR